LGSIGRKWKVALTRFEKIVLDGKDLKGIERYAVQGGDEVQKAFAVSVRSQRRSHWDDAIRLLENQRLHQRRDFSAACSA
jgi:hypothetical protein